jgi:hypothetical protein
MVNAGPWMEYDHNMGPNIYFMPFRHFSRLPTLNFAGPKCNYKRKKRDRKKYPASLSTVF